MTTHPITEAKVRAVYERYLKAPGKNITEKARAMKMPRGTLGYYINVYFPKFGIERPKEPLSDGTEPFAEPSPQLAKLKRLLRGSALDMVEICNVLDCSPKRARELLDQLKGEGATLHQVGDKHSIHALEPAYVKGSKTALTSDKNNRFRFGVVADSHLCSKYQRLDCLNDIYDRFVETGITDVFHCGNWIDGEARFNRTELLIHGMGPQLRYLAENYPQRSGITTYAVTGDDHEGWYAARDGVDIGVLAEDAMRRVGRNDWVNLGYMEAHVPLINGATRKQSMMAVAHPGGGVAYADSYVVQKILESLDGGEKPAVALYGHYHKCLAGNYRNVWWVLVPSTKDQDTFMRKKRIRSVVGGGIIELEQDPATGAIIGMTPKLWQYYNKGYYEGRWSHDGNVVQPERSIHV